MINWISAHQCYEDREQAWKSPRVLWEINQDFERPGSDFSDESTMQNDFISDIFVVGLSWFEKLLHPREF